jgi:hypothetical protein
MLDARRAVRHAHDEPSIVDAERGAFAQKQARWCEAGDQRSELGDGSSSGGPQHGISSAGALSNRAFHFRTARAVQPTARAICSVPCPPRVCSTIRARWTTRWMSCPRHTSSLSSRSRSRGMWSRRERRSASHALSIGPALRLFLKPGSNFRLVVLACRSSVGGSCSPYRKSSRLFACPRSRLY